jgi:hypothetical protein
MMSVCAFDEEFRFRLPTLSDSSLKSDVLYLFWCRHAMALCLRC